MGAKLANTTPPPSEDFNTSEDEHLDAPLSKRWNTKHTLVTVGIIVLMYVAYKQMK